MTLHEKIESDFRKAAVAFVFVAALVQLGLFYSSIEQIKDRVLNLTLGFAKSVSRQALTESNLVFIQKDLARFHEELTRVIQIPIRIAANVSGRPISHVGAVTGAWLTTTATSELSLPEGGQLGLQVDIGYGTLLAAHVGYFIFSALLLFLGGWYLKSKAETRLLEAVTPLQELAAQTEAALQALPVEEPEARPLQSAGNADEEVLARVAHDIRSPLSALNVIAYSATQLDRRHKELLEATVKRIQDIADSILKRPVPPSTAVVAPPSAEGATEVKGVVAALIDEKRVRWQHRKGISFEVSDALPHLKLLVKVPRADVSRALSNLLDNAVEASPNHSTVTVEVSQADGQCVLSIVDRGKGIPADRLPLLGLPGATFDKEGGTGFGIFSAKHITQSAGGSFSIRSQVGHGTAIELRFPLAAPSPA